MSDPVARLNAALERGTPRFFGLVAFVSGIAGDQEMCIKTTVSVMATAILAVAACAPSPEGMLEELITTIDQGDLLRFEALVDVDAVVMDFSTEFRGRLEGELGEC